MKKLFVFLKLLFLITLTEQEEQMASDCARESLIWCKRWLTYLHAKGRFDGYFVRFHLHVPYQNYHKVISFLIKAGKESDSYLKILDAISVFMPCIELLQAAKEDERFEGICRKTFAGQIIDNDIFEWLLNATEDYKKGFFFLEILKTSYWWYGTYDASNHLLKFLEATQKNYSLTELISKYQDLSINNETFTWIVEAIRTDEKKYGFLFDMPWKMDLDTDGEINLLNATKHNKRFRRKCQKYFKNEKLCYKTCNWLLNVPDKDVPDEDEFFFGILDSAASLSLDGDGEKRLLEYAVQDNRYKALCRKYFDKNQLCVDTLKSLSKESFYFFIYDCNVELSLGDWHNIIDLMIENNELEQLSGMKLPHHAEIHVIYRILMGLFKQSIL